MAHSNKREAVSHSFARNAVRDKFAPIKNFTAMLFGAVIGLLLVVLLAGCVILVPANAGRAGVYNPPPPVYASRPNVNTVRITCGPIGINRQIITAPYRNPHDGVWSCSSVDYYPLPVPPNCPRPNVYAWDIENNRYRGVGCG